MPEARRRGLSEHIAESRDVCLVFPEELEMPQWWWNNTEYYHVRVRLNGRTMASFYVLELQQDPPEF